jgi:membrane protease subunit (stomatin/prohibitin family)
MGFMDRVRGQFIDIVEFLDDSRDTLVWRFPRQGNEIKMGAQLVVREGQAAVFENEGRIADVFAPGTYTLETQNLPVLSDLKGWKYGFDSPFKAEVYFVGTRLYTDLKWGTQHPVTLRDAEFGMVRLRAFGTYAVKVDDPAKLLRQLVGTDPQFRTDEVAGFLRETIVGQVGTALANSNLPMLDLAANQQTIAATLAGTLSTNLADLGISVPKFVITNISLPPEVEAMLDKRTSMGVVGDLDRFTRFQAANAVEDAANNPAGGNNGLGLGVGVALGEQVAGALAGHGGTIAAAPAAGSSAAAPAGGPPPLPTAAPWYLGVGGRQVGPVAPDDLGARLAAGELTRETLVWRQGMASWTPAGDVPELQPVFASVPPPLPPTLPPTPPSTPPSTPPPTPAGPQG